MNRSSNLQTGEGLRSILIAAALLIMVKSGFTQSVSTGNLYLGQTPPGNTPEVFPLSVKQGFFAAERIAISNDGREIYYSELKGYYPNTGESIKKFSFSGGKWIGPITLFDGYAAPALSVTGDTMYVETNFETYISEKNGSGWTKPINFGTVIDFGLGSWGPWVTPDDKYLFYSTGTKRDYSDVSVYWVRIDGLIDSLKNISMANSIK